MKTATRFRGDSDLMVDALISASQMKANSSGEVMPGYGRDLVPYFESGEHDDSGLDGTGNGGQRPFQGIAPPRRVYADCGAPMADSAPMPIPQTQQGYVRTPPLCVAAQHVSPARRQRR